MYRLQARGWVTRHWRIPVFVVLVLHAMNCNRGLLRGSRNKPHNCFYQSVRQSRTFSQLENASSVERPKLVSGLYWGSKNCTWERQFDRSTKRRTNWDRRPRAGMKFWKGSNVPTPPPAKRSLERCKSRQQGSDRALTANIFGHEKALKC